MSLTYAGVNLMVPRENATAWVERKLRPQEMQEFDRLTSPLPGQQQLAFRTPAPPPFRLNVLHWPRGASQWATFHFLASQNQLTKIRAAVYATNKTQAMQQLVMDDGKNAVTASMWLLPPRPVSQIPGRNDLALCTLVDDRYFWWDRAAAITVTGATTWSQLYAAIGTGLGVTVAADAVPAAYLTPSADFTSLYQYLPVLLDAAAFSCGQRIVRTLDGKVLAQSPLTAIASVKKQYATGYPVEAGGWFALNPNNAPCDLYGLVPSSVTVTFPRADSGVLSGAVTAYTVTLASLTLPEYKNVPGYSGTQVFQANTIAAWSGGGSPLNEAELTALAQQVATDYYRWRLGVLDVKLAHIAPWVPDGLHDAEWAWQPGDFSTRIKRGPWNELAMRQIGINGSYAAAICSCTQSTGGVFVLRPTGIPSSEAFGTPSIALSAATLLPAGIPSSEAFGVPTVAAAGGIGTISLAFNGTDQYVVIPDATILRPTAFTASGWAKVTGSSVGQIFGKSDGFTAAWKMQVSSSFPYRLLQIHTSQAFDFSSTDTAWHHWAITFDGAGNGTLYIDGVSVATMSGASLNYDTSPISIGAIVPDSGFGIPSSFLTGHVFDFRLYDAVVSVSDIYNGGTPSFTDATLTGGHLLGWWKLNEGSGSTALDSSINGNDGTYINSPAWVSDIP